MSASFEGKTVIVTGAANGIGRATALAFAEAGARLVLADVNQADGEAVAHRIETGGGSAIFVRTDVCSSDAAADMVAAGVRAFGRIGCAFNNAGIAPRGAPPAEMADADWTRVLAVNLTGVFNCMKHQIPELLRAGGGGIVNTASIMGVVSGPGLGAYSASKAGVVGLTKAAAVDYATRGIVVNAICPGGIGGTGLTDAPENAGSMEQLRLMTPMQRLGVPQDIAQTVLWLCSPAARFLTGQAIAVDGGYTAI